MNGQSQRRVWRSVPAMQRAQVPRRWSARGRALPTILPVYPVSLPDIGQLSPRTRRAQTQAQASRAAMSAAGPTGPRLSTPWPDQQSCTATGTMCAFQRPCFIYPLSTGCMRSECVLNLSALAHGSTVQRQPNRLVVSHHPAFPLFKGDTECKAGYNPDVPDILTIIHATKQGSLCFTRGQLSFRSHRLSATSSSPAFAFRTPGDLLLALMRSAPSTKH